MPIGTLTLKFWNCKKYTCSNCKESWQGEESTDFHIYGANIPINTCLSCLLDSIPEEKIEELKKFVISEEI